jgi:hypothetical protein
MDIDNLVKEIYKEIPHFGKKDMDFDEVVDYALSYLLSNSDAVNEFFADSYEED